MDWQLQEIALTGDGNTRKRLVGGIPFRTQEGAARYAAVLAKTYPKNGYNKLRGCWWSEDHLGSKLYFEVVHEPSICKALPPSKTNSLRNPIRRSNELKYISRF